MSPNVDLIWNFFPITLLVWNPLRALLNLPFSLLQVFIGPIEVIWNFGPETFIMYGINGYIILLEGLIIYLEKD